MENCTTVTVFILVELTEDPKLQIVLFIFLLACLLSMLGNLVIVTLALLDSHLKIPMYLFHQNINIYFHFHCKHSQI